MSYAFNVVFTCDRCGSSEQRPADPKTLQQSPERWRYVRFGTSNDWDIDAELCGVCAESFREWLQGEVAE